ncbi:EamA family transporter [Anoxybacillus sp. UARK-01]|uniref:DMT family transporter n=1 Tax=Anoxybacillus sp. UARK-01 TaxID=1895648 RepID=UPI0009BA78B4|nr:DMT family transporter [Anoxybacillus sp. UARK-01]OQM46110.1 EamA family transporter [Anoxybacillus sp. UARK-01]
MSQMKANVMLFLITIFWGSSYLFMKMGLNSIQPFSLIAWRFGIAFCLSSLIFYRRLLQLDRKIVKRAALLGTILFFVFAFVTVGVKSTSTSHAGFLVGFTVVLVPLFSAIFLKKKPEKRVIIGAGAAMCGIGLLTLNHGFAISQGDIFCLMTAVSYAAHIMMTGQLTKNVDSIALGVLQLGFCGGLGALCSLLFESPSIPTQIESWIAIFSLSIFCSAIGFVVQTVAQKYTTATYTGLIFSLEPVFAALFGYIFLEEVLPLKGYFGAALVLFGVIYAQVQSGKQKRQSIAARKAMEM